MASLIVYHKNCRNGAFAAAAFLYSQGQTEPKWTHTFKSLNAGPKPEEEDEILAMVKDYKQVVLLDVCSKRLFEEIPKLTMLHVIDHHASTYEYMPNYHEGEPLSETVFGNFKENNYTIHLSQRISAAMMVFHQNRLPQKLFDLYTLVSDYDMGNHNDPKVTTVSAVIDEAQLNFEDIPSVLAWITDNPSADVLFKFGEAEALRKRKEKVDKIIAASPLRFTTLGENDRIFGVMPITLEDIKLVNDVSKRVRELTRLAIGPTHVADKEVCSLLTREDPTDLYLYFRCDEPTQILTVAKRFGGGGHLQACGAKAPLKTDLGLVDSLDTLF